MAADTQTPLPGTGLSTEKMPGHWLLARLGKRVLRPGGRQLTCRMIEALNIQPPDDVVEFAPGLGATARLTLERRPASFTAVERDKDAAARVRGYLRGAKQRCVVGAAAETGLPGASATVVYGEAMLTMQPSDQKARIVREAFRLLKPGGRYGIHELCFAPDELEERTQREVQNAISQAIHVGAKPLTPAGWQRLLESEGFTVRAQARAAMALLEPWRLIQDEGLIGALRFVWNVAKDPSARQRVLAMRQVFRRYCHQLAAIMMIGQKPEGAGP
jgi:ubiquinone/menaquinone biosynthesis C-methylase UbiE